MTDVYRCVNPLVAFVIARLAPLLAANGGAFKQIVVADSTFNRVAFGQAGPVNLPLCGVGYAGSDSVRPLEAGGAGRYRRTPRLAVFVMHANLQGVASDLAAADVGLYDILDRVIALLTGVRPVRVDASGVPLRGDGTAYSVDSSGYLLDDSGDRVLIDGAPLSPFDLPDPGVDDYVYLGGPLVYLRDQFVALPEAARKAGLNAWSIEFGCLVGLTPDAALAASRNAEYLGHDGDLYYPADSIDAAADESLLDLIADPEGGNDV